MKIKLLIVLLFVLASCSQSDAIQVIDEPTIEPTISPTIEMIPTATQVPTPTIEFIPLDVKVKASDHIFYYDGCIPHHKITIFAWVGSPHDIYAASLYIKFLDREGEGMSDWHEVAVMNQISSGPNAAAFSATLVGDDLKGIKRQFEVMTMYYQVVVWSAPNVRSVSSDVMRDVTFSVCPRGS